MKNKLLLQNIFFTLIALSPVLTMALLWNTIPDQIPFRKQYSFHGDGIGLSPKDNLWGSIPVVAVVSLFIYYLFAYIKRVDPKRASKEGGNVFMRIAIGLTLLLTALNFIMLFDNIGRLHDGKQVMMPMLGVFFAFLGNVMHNVKANYFVGLRLPWTLSSDYNWKKTHMLAGKLWFTLGLLFSISYMITPGIWTDTTFGIWIAVLIGVPSIYSFVLYLQEKQKTHQ